MNINFVEVSSKEFSRSSSYFNAAITKYPFISLDSIRIKLDSELN